MPPKPSNPDSILDPKDISYTLLLARGRVLTYTLGGGVALKPSDPDPISDPKRHFLHSIVSQGEEYLLTLWVGVCRPSLQILTLFQTRKSIFLYFILDQAAAIDTSLQTRRNITTIN